MRATPFLTVMAPLLISCASSPSQEAAMPDVVGAEQTWAATIAPRAGVGTQISGRIRLVPTGRPNQLRVEGNIRGGGFQTQLPWTIRQGNCGEAGQELGNPLSYRDIVMGPDGSATLSGTIPVVIPSTGTYHIAILANSSDRDRIVACGVLSPAT